MMTGKVKMMKYSTAQIETLKALRTQLFEDEFEIRELYARHAKNQNEFAVVSKKGWNFESALVRMFHGKVRIVFLEVQNAWGPQLRVRILNLGERCGCPIVFAPGYRNDAHCRFRRFPPRSWEWFVRKREFKRGGLDAALHELKSAGVHIQKGVSGAP